LCHTSARDLIGAKTFVLNVVAKDPAPEEGAR
jgi:hypothetical protein